MSGIVKREGNRLDATYDNPWGGVASNADASDIQPSQFVQGDGIYIKNGRVCSAGWGNTITYNFSKVAGQKYWLTDRMQMVLLVKPNNGGWVTVAFDNNGGAYIYDGTVFVLDQLLNAGSFITFSCFQVIGGVVYIFDWNAGASYKYIPHVSYTTNSTFVGGKYCMTLDNYLITCNTNQPSDNPAIKENRYNWSAPFAYGTWDPAVDRTAGFNTLTSAQDQISGCFAMGNVGYLLRTQGVTQLSPTGIGISPFDATDLWASQFGIGCTYPESFSQYGSLAIWANTNDIYGFFSGTVPQSITGSAQAAIYSDVNQYETDYSTAVAVRGAFANASENTRVPALLYMFAIFASGVNVPSGLQAKVWTLSLETKVWTRQIFNIGDMIAQIVGSTTHNYSIVTLKVFGLQTPYRIGFLTQEPPKRIIANMLVSVGDGVNVLSFLFGLFYNENGVLSLTGAQINVNMTHREEEIRLGIKPTVRGVIVKAAGTGTLSIKVSGQAFTDIIVAATKARTYKSFGELTEENPQLSISSTTFDGYIAKVSMNMTYDEGSPL